MQIYLIAAIALFSIAGLLLGYGLPNTILHPRPGGSLYGGSTFLDENGNFVNYYNPIYGLTTVYGMLASAVGIVMFVLYRTSANYTVENKTK